MRHPTPEELKPLLDAVDVVCWAWAVKTNTKKHEKCRADWKGAIVDLQEAFGAFQLQQSDAVAVLSDASSHANTRGEGGK
jgi:hypothetical protein